MKKTFIYILFVLSILLIYFMLQNIHHMTIRYGIFASLCLTVIVTLIYFLVKIRGEYQSSLNQMRTFFDNCPDMLSLKGPDLKFIKCNKAFYKALNLNDANEIIGKTDFELIPKEIAELIKTHDEQVIQKKSIERYNALINSKTYGNKIYEVISAPLKIKNKTLGILTIARDNTIKENLKKQYIENLIQINAIMNNLPIIAYLTDANGIYIRGNNKLAEALKCSQNEFIGKSAEEIYKKFNIKTIRPTYEQVIREKKPVKYETTVNLDNREQTFKIYKSPIFNEYNNVTGVTVFIRNITQEKEAEKQRETFVATLSHDLKTPTIAQIRSLELLMNGSFGELTPEQKEITQMTLDSCKYMYDMVSTVITMYKYENNEIILNLQNNNILKILNECCENLEPKLKEKNLTIRISSSELSNQNLAVDKLQLKNAIEKFLTHSISYAYENTEIQIDLFTNKNEDFEIKIHSKCPYFEPELLQSFFEKYKSHDTKFSKVGDGLGLYLAKQIITAHNGETFAQSFESNNLFVGFFLKSKNYTKV